MNKINFILMITLVLWLMPQSDISKASLRYTPWTVNSTSDGADAQIDGHCADLAGICTLRAAIEEANATAEPDEINLPAGIYQLNIGQLNIKSAITINGSESATTSIDANYLSRIFRVSNSASLTLNHVTLRGGNAGANDGGAISAKDSQLFINNSMIQNSIAANGGGISLVTGTATLTNTTITQNDANYGGGIYALDGSLTISDSVISANTAVHDELPIGWGGVFMLLIQWQL